MRPVARGQTEILAVLRTLSKVTMYFRFRVEGSTALVDHNREAAVLAHACIPGTWEAQVRGLSQG